MDYSSVKYANKALNFDEARRGVTHLKSRPLFFWFDIYGPCNLKCVHCGYRKEGRTSEEEVAEAVYAEVMQQLMPTAYTCNLGGTNWGEMTISKNFHRFLLDCLKFGVKVNLTTNGTRMNDQWVNDLADAAEVVGFSMEGMGAEFETVRGFPWRRFVENIEKLIQNRQDRGKTFRVEWRYCAHSDSIRQLPEMIRTAKRMGIDRIQVMPLVPYVREQQYKNLSYHRSLANECFDLARSVAQELDFSIRIPDNYATGQFVDRPLKIKSKKDVETVPEPDETIEMVNCFRPWQACAINELGVVKPCCVYWRGMGNLKDGGFEAVWNGSTYRSLRKSVNGKPDSICYDCRLPSFSDSGRTAAELRPSPKQFARDLVASVLHPPKVQFTDVLDPHLDPRSEKSIKA